MQNNMKYVNKQMVVVINKMAVALTGGSNLSQNNIRSGQSLGFIERLHTNEVFGEIIYPDIFHQAAAYMFYIIKNHIFFDGNKRTGLAVAISFLKWNHIKFTPLDEDAVFDFVVDVAGGENSPDNVIPKIAKWLKNLSKLEA